MHPVDEIFDALGGPTAISAKTGIKVQTVCDWRKKGVKNIPAWRRAPVLDAVQASGTNLSLEALRYLTQSPAA